jgi:predicted lipoprotein with Yx(FWY)xxD motif
MSGRPLAATVLAGVLAGSLAACSGGASAGVHRPPANRTITLSVRTVSGLGRILVTDGWTLYMYPPDRQRQVTCTKVEECEQAWPPLYVSAGQVARAGTGVKPGLIGTISGDGGEVVTYNHWPLYYYIGDRKAGQVNGQDQGFNWFVISPDGVPNKADLGSSTG